MNQWQRIVGDEKSFRCAHDDIFEGKYLLFSAMYQLIMRENGKKFYERESSTPDAEEILDGRRSYVKQSFKEDTYV